MEPVSREEIYLYKLAGGSITLPSPVSRKEMYLAKACGEAVTVPDPVSREEMYLYKLAGGSITLPAPVSRLELLMAAACGEAVTSYTPVSRLEWFWSRLILATITGVPPIQFTADGSGLTAVIIFGNTLQSGTPTPDALIYPDFCGALSGSDWTIPIICGGQTVTVDLSQVQTVRRIKKLVLTGSENWTYEANNSRFIIRVNDAINMNTRFMPIVCSHFQCIDDGRAIGNVPDNSVYNGLVSATVQNINFKCTAYTSDTDFKQFLADKYANGTPVTVWYVLATEQTGIVNEPLAKIGDYADELHSEDAGVAIPTVSGSNTLTIGTTLQPSSVSITGHISQ